MTKAAYDKIAGLIARLRDPNWYGWKRHLLSWEAIDCDYRDAADAIEAQAAEIKALKSGIDRKKSERDAALARVQELSRQVGTEAVARMVAVQDDAQEPPLGLLESMATCLDHGFGAPDMGVHDYRKPDIKTYRSRMLGDMRKLYDEVVGRGYWKLQPEAAPAHGDAQERAITTTPSTFATDGR